MAATTIVAIATVSRRRRRRRARARANTIITTTVAITIAARSHGFHLLKWDSPISITKYPRLEPILAVGTSAERTQSGA